jgi:hypothetical protein
MRQEALTVSRSFFLSLCLCFVCLCVCVLVCGGGEGLLCNTVGAHSPAPQED